jgi:hypothetical protein
MRHGFRQIRGPNAGPNMEDLAKNKVKVWNLRPGCARVTEGVKLFFSHGSEGPFPPAARRGVFRHRPPILGSSSSSASV